MKLLSVIDLGFFLPEGAKFFEKYTSLGSEKVMKISISFFKILSLEFVNCCVPYVLQNMLY